MPLIQGGPPEWIWERTADPLKIEVVPSRSPDRQMVYELRLNCGLEILRLQFLTRAELHSLHNELAGLPPEEPAQVATDEGRQARTPGVVSDPDLAPRRLGDRRNTEQKCRDS